MEEKIFINNLLHFNLEFVAGEYNTYDKLLNEAFDPALDVFLDCPKWHADIEVSGMQLEYMEKNFPWMVEKLQKLNQRNQIDVICVHYSETMWPAFPLYDFRKSWSIDREIIERLHLKFSKTFFAQENFFGEGLAAVKDEFGIKNAVIPEKNYFWPYNRLNPLYPVYEMNGLNLIIRGDEKNEDGSWWAYTTPNNALKIKWTYDKCGDGEPWVGDDPYVNFVRSEKKIAQKKELYDWGLEHGVHFTTTNEFIHEITKLGIEKPQLKPIPDGPWGLEKPGMFQWQGFYFSYYELDVEMRSLEYRSRAMLLAAEALMDIARSQRHNIEIYEIMLDRGWKKQINSEVSDSSGWVPTLPEMYYGIDNAITAFYWGEKICRDLRTLLKLTDESIDTDGKKIISSQKADTTKIPPIDSSYVPKEIIPEFLGPNQSISWTKCENNIYQLDFAFIHADIECGLRFRFLEDILQYSPALMDFELVKRPFSFYSPECTHLYLPLPNGLISLGNEWWVIKHNDCCNVTAKVDFKNRKIEFVMLMNIMALGGREELGIEIDHHWKFTLLKGTPKEALSKARKINLFPVVPPQYKLWETVGKKPYPWIPFTRMVSK
jgi:hypothetical protein